MDPYYFLNDIEYSDDSEDLSELCEYYPNGDWELVSTNDNKIIYKNKLYDTVSYINTEKKIYFKNNTEINLVLELMIREV